MVALDRLEGRQQSTSTSGRVTRYWLPAAHQHTPDLCGFLPCPARIELKRQRCARAVEDKALQTSLVGPALPSSSRAAAAAASSSATARPATAALIQHAGGRDVPVAARVAAEPTRLDAQAQPRPAGRWCCVKHLRVEYVKPPTRARAQPVQ